MDRAEGNGAEVDGAEVAGAEVDGVETKSNLNFIIFAYIDQLQ